MSELLDLYQEVVLDHNSRPRNYKKLEKPSHSADGFNPLCGDKITLYVELEKGVIKDIAFQGAGCAISRASASLMTQSVKGKPAAEAEKLFNEVHRMLTRNPDEAVEDDLGDLAALAGVAEFPSRVKCASLSWHTLKAALKGKHQPVSTETGGAP